MVLPAVVFEFKCIKLRRCDMMTGSTLALHSTLQCQDIMRLIMPDIHSSDQSKVEGCTAFCHPSP